MNQILSYVTGNSAKFNTAKYFLGLEGIEIRQEISKIDEIQSESIEEVTEDKARKAFQTVKAPLFVNDSGWVIPALNGFPGPFMKYINQWFNDKDFLNLMKDKDNQQFILKEVYVYFDGETLKTFKYDYPGKFLDQAIGSGLPSEMVMSLTSDGKSIAEKNSQDKRAESYNKFWKDFANWLSIFRTVAKNI